MSTTSRRPLASTDALRRHAVLLAGELGATGGTDPRPVATDRTDSLPEPDPSRERGAGEGSGPDGSLEAAMWRAAQELRPAPPPADRPGPAVPLPYREAAAPVPEPEERLDRRG